MSSINPVFERLISAERVHIWCQIPMKRVAGAMISIETVITLLPVMAAPCWNNIGKYSWGQEQWEYWPCVVTNMTNEDPYCWKIPCLTVNGAEVCNCTSCSDGKPLIGQLGTQVRTQVETQACCSLIFEEQSCPLSHNNCFFRNWFLNIWRHVSPYISG